MSDALAKLFRHGHFGAMIATLRRKAGNFFRLPGFTIGWLVSTWLLMGVFALALRILPIRRLAPAFGHGIGATAVVPCLPLQRMGRAIAIRQLVDLAARHAPFRSDCFPQALVAVTLCRLFGLPFAMHFGVRRAERHAEERGTLAAHAWVVSGPVALSGGNASFHGYTSVGCFVSRDLETSPGARTADG